MDPLLTQIIVSGTGEAVKIMTEKLLSSRWLKGTEECIGIIEQLDQLEIRNKYIEKHVSNALRMRTLHQREHDILLDDIYFPLTIINAANSDELIVNDECTISHSRILNIIGIAGQGKSTILRKLFQNEIRLNNRIPFFLELRRIEKGTVLDYFKLTLESLGIDINRSNNHVELLLQSGKIILMLDGFDEVKANSRHEILSQIRELNIRFNCPIIVTSRPETEVCRETSINNLSVKALDEESQLGILKVLSNQTEFKELSSVIRDNPQLKETLKTPILINLLYVCYPYWDELPSNVVEFYNKLYITLYLKHDRMKSWARERKSTLNTDDSLWCFSALCYFSMKDEVFEFDTISLAKYARKALNAANFEAKECEAFVDDIINITCLIQQDGLDRYVFLHKSVQEYHAAYTISCLPKEINKQFYDSITENLSSNDKFDNVLTFLHYIDKDSFQKYISIEYFEKLGLAAIANVELDDVCEFLINKIEKLAMYAEKTENEQVSWQMVDVMSSALGLDILPLMRGGQRLYDELLDESILEAANKDFHISELEKYDYSYVVNPMTKKNSVTKFRIKLTSFMIENNLLLDTAERLKSITSEYYRCVYMPLLEERQRKTQALYKEFEIKREP
ncbi:TPA: NACHT domain-containing protein [Klebsiella pneumoniae]|uniref:NACHT domain-containing protein n=1 Tax=Klebsiella pneumoniae TaxID=573 RepID=UPI001CBD721D|nr:NACHT domain-containing protein [Klebsiella pneumoniae]MBZ1948088.1 NACHT domain-containing protein [Klebsiella pneumoniae]HBW7322523.1 NACHT domain-containing protein [Klebsiella pneumoniae]HEC0091652.1 NACHT domain-containing protein [Klebsiella pneumoniae]